MLKTKNNYLFENEKPFFWLGDTSWLLGLNTTINEAKLYLNNRKKLGYNVIQMILFYNLPNNEIIAGQMPTTDKDNYSKKYINYINEIITYAESLNIYVGLVPFWGSIIKKGLIKKENINEIVNFLVNTFTYHSNLIWILGGDIRGDYDYTLFDSLGTSLKKKDPNHLITFHPFGRTLSSRWFNDCNWLDFNMFQSGHRRYDQVKLQAWDDEETTYYGEDCWRYVIENNEYQNIKPCLDGEPSYEGIVQGLHNLNEPYWEAGDIRRYAYWSVFTGACGFTYGNNAIIQFYSPKLKYGSYGVRETWFEALSSEGGSQLQYLKNLMLSVDFTKGKNHNDYLISPQKEKYGRVIIFAGEDYLFAYNYTGDEYTINLSNYLDKKLECYWMNPQNGSLSYFNTIYNQEKLTVKPTKRHELSNDWVLVLKKI